MNPSWTHGFFPLLTLILTWLGGAECQLDSNVCKKVDYVCGPPPPEIPTNYILKREVIHENKAGWEEEYFDSFNFRAKLVSVKKSNEIVNIFDYEQNELTQYSLKRPGASVETDPTDSNACVVRKLTSVSDSELPFGNRFHSPKAKRIRMSNAFEALKFGGNYRYNFSNVEVDQFISRNLHLDAFNGCIFDEVRNGTFNMTYMFVRPSSSLRLSNSEPTMPIHVTREGAKGNEYKESIAWFKSNPDFTDQEFQIPREMHCVNILPGRKKWQPLADKFSFRKETISYDTDSDGDQTGDQRSDYEEIWYDSSKNLSRLDLISETYPDLAKQLGPGVCSITMDFNHDVALMSNTATGECRIAPIPRELSILVNTDEEQIQMQSPETVFGLSRRAKYKGKYKVRGMEVDTWTEDVGIADNISTWREISFTTDDWHSESDGNNIYHTPVQEITLMSGYQQSKFVHHVSVSNYFKARMSEPPLSAFQNQKCFDQNVFRTYEFRFDQSYTPAIEQRRDKFLQAVRQALFPEFGSYVRISHPEIAESNDHSNDTIVSITALEELPIIGLKPLDNVYKGLTALVEEVELKILLTLEDGNVKYFSPKSVKEIKQNYDSYTYEFREPSFEPQFSDSASDGPPKKQDPEGYSPGSLAAIAICMLIVGLLIGGGAMIYYLRKIKNKDEEPIPLSEK